MTNGKKWLAILMAMVMTLGAASALAEGGMAEDKTMCGEDCMCMEGKACMKDGMCMDACMCGKDGTMEDDMSSMFPAFEGMDLDGNPVTSELFGENAVTVVNFWFSTCSSCIAELSALNTLNESLKEKGGAVIGINADTIGGNEKMIMEAKALLDAKGATFQNLYFPTESAVGQLTHSITAFPITVVVDRNGFIVGDVILGGVNNEAQMKALQAIIDDVLMKDMEKMAKDNM